MSPAIRAGRAYVELSARDEKLNAAMKRSEARVKVFADIVMSAGKRLAVAGAAIVAPLTAASAAFVSMGQDAYRASKNIGVGTELLQSLGYAADQAAGSMSDMEGAIKKVNKTIDEARDGSAEASDVLKKWGVSLDKVVGLNAEQRFRAVVDALGKGGELAAMEKQLRNLGILMSGDSVRAAHEFRNSLETVKLQAKGISAIIGEPVARAMNEYTKALSASLGVAARWLQTNQGAISTTLRVGSALFYAGTAAVTLAGGMPNLVAAFEIAGKAAGSLWSSVKLIGPVLAAAVSPIALAGVAIAGLGAAVLYYSGIGGEALRWLGEKFGWLKDEASAAFSLITDAIKAGRIDVAAKVAWGLVKVVWAESVAWVQTKWAEMWGWIGENTGIKSLSDAFGVMWHNIKIAWIEGVAFVKRLWAEISSIGEAAVHTLNMGGIAQQLDMGAISPAEAQRMIDAEKARHSGKKTDIDAEKADRIAAINRERNAAMNAEGERYAKANAGVVAPSTAASIAAAQAELAAAITEWEATKADAKSATKSGGQPLSDRLAGIIDKINAAGATIAVKAKEQVAGGFNTAAAFGMGGGVANAIKTATELSAQRLQQILTEMRQNGLAW